MAGLQDIAPMVAKRWVTKAVFAPIRAAALAASQPAWPPPITMASKESTREIMPRLLSRSWKTRKQELLDDLGCLFHVKHWGLWSRWNVSRETTPWSRERSLTYTELPEDDVQNILDI